MQNKFKTKSILATILPLVGFLFFGGISAESAFAYSASLTTSNDISLDAVMSEDGTSIRSESINVQTDCRAGYNLTIATPEGSDLYKYDNGTQSSNTASFTAVDGTSALNSNNNTNKWGYTLTTNPSGSTIFSPLSTTESILKTSSQTASPTSDINDTFNINYGVKVDRSMGIGSYKMANNGTIVYYLTMDTTCSEYTVAFNPNGGTGTMNSQKIQSGVATDLVANSFTAPALGTSYTDAAGNTVTGTPTTFWSFAGWNTAIDGSGTSYDDEESVTDIISAGSTITLYAQWEGKEAMLVNYNGDGLQFEGGNTTNTVAYYNDCGTKYVSSPEYSHTSNINDDGTQIGSTTYSNNLATKDTLTIPGADSLHATIKYGTENNYDMLYVFEGEYTGSVTRNMNAGQLATYMGGNNTVTTVELDIPGDTATFAFYSDGSSTYWGYHVTLVGYYDEEPASYDTTTYVCTRRLVDGEYEEPITSSAQHFTGWSDSSSASSPDYTSAEDILENLPGDNGGTINLYAKWDEYYYIAFNANESSVGATPGSATGTMTNQTVTRGVATNIKTSTFALSGYLFLGWNTAADGTGIFYTDEQMVTNLTAAGSTITLYAVWTDGAYLDTGTTVNQKLKRLAGNSSATSTTQDTAISAIVRSNALPNNFTPSDENTISHSSSPTPIYAWYDSANTTIYYYSTANDILMNKDSSSFFKGMEVLSNLSTISTWDTSRVTNMYNMFNSTGQSVTTFSLNLSSWNTSSVTSMTCMFCSAGYSATTFSLDLSSWNTSGVTTMGSMFSSAGHSATTWSIGDISSWNTSRVTDMDFMFTSAGYSATTFTLDLSSWNTASVTSMSYMFQYAGYSATTWSTGDLSDWNTSGVVDMSSMFQNAGHSATTWSTGDLSDWNTSSVTNMGSMFQNAGHSATTWSTGDLSDWNTSGVVDMSSMFQNAGYNATTWSIGDLSSWNTTSVTSMYSMFNSAGHSATTFTLDLSSWNTASVTSMQLMFNSAGYSATTWSIGNLSSWNTASVTNMSSMFAYAGFSATTWSIGNLSSWNTSSVTSMVSMFKDAGYSATTWSIGNLSSWNTSGVGSTNSMFYYAGYSATTWSIGDISSWNTSNVTQMGYMFYYAGHSATTWSVGNLSSWNTPNVVNMERMFCEAGYSATAFTLNLSSWKTANVTNMTQMFERVGYSATTWSIGNLSSWNTASVTNMSSMFAYAGFSATTFSLDLSSWNTSSVTSMYQMFTDAGYSATTWSVGDLSSWNTSSVTSMYQMFTDAGHNASSFNLNISSWNTSNVTSILQMFLRSGNSATTWSVTIPKTNNGTTSGPISNTTSNLYGNTTSVTATPDSGRSFTLAN